MQLTHAKGAREPGRGLPSIQARSHQLICFREEGNRGMVFLYVKLALGPTPQSGKDICV